MTEQRPPDVGSRVEALRATRGLSMRALAELCDLSPNTISLIERGISSPSVSTLHRLATAMEVPITAFFEEVRETVELILSRAGERQLTLGAGASLASLGTGLEGQSMDPFVVVLEPGADSGPDTIVHPGHELI
jgi:transcriptional regulator with XRE-family HTH domain